VNIAVRAGPAVAHRRGELLYTVGWDRGRETPAVRDRNARVLEHLCCVLEGKGDRTTNAERVAELIGRSGGYRWVGIYEVQGDEIAAVAWSGQGEPAHPRFLTSQGLCGGAARSGGTVAVGDLTRDARYLTTFGGTRSEIVVPVRHSATRAVLGLIDVESERLNAFADDDRGFLEKCASGLTCLWE